MTIKNTRSILIDKPGLKDEFSGGGHQRTAIALAKTIRQFDGDNRAIGLEGTWGAGKSTTVELAREELEKDESEKKFSVFTFDLWTHQTSNFKRSILESLLTWIENQNDVKRQNIKKIDIIRNEIRDKIVDTRTKNKKIFDGYGIVFIIFAFFLPLIYIWLSPSVILKGETTKTDIAWYFFPSIPWGSKVSLILVFLMVLLTIIRFSYYFIFSNESKFLQKLKDAGSSTVAILSKDAQVFHERKTIKEIDPTQAEFYETFQRILSLYQTDLKRIVIVVDNIDRLPDGRLADAWSDIRSMVVGQTPPEIEPQFVTLIVPYDRQHVLAVLKSSNVLDGDIIRKTFDAVFQVSAPVVSDASNFFEKKFKEAMASETDHDTAYRVFKIFEFSIQTQKSPATPRQMLAFINGVTMLWEQWSGEIPLVTVAVFIANASELYAHPDQLRQSSTISQRYRDLARSDNLDRDLAALAYNVEPSLAFQVLLHTEIAKAFIQTESEPVFEISKAPGFAEILPEVFSEQAGEWSNEGAVYFGRAAKRLFQLDVSSGIKHASRSELFKNIERMPPTKPSKWEEISDIISLIDLCDNHQVLTVVADLSAWLIKCINDESGPTFDHGAAWIVMVGSIISRVDDVFEEEFLSKEARRRIITIDNAAFVLGAAYYADQTKIQLKQLSIKKPQNLLNNLSETVLEDPEMFAEIWPELEYLAKDEASPLISAISNQLSSQIYSEEVSEDHVQHLNNLCTLIKSTPSFEKAPTELHQLVSDGSLYKAIKAIFDKGDDRYAPFIANAFWLIIREGPDGVINNPNIQNHKFGNLTEQKEWIQERIIDGDLGENVVEHLGKLVLSDAKFTMLIEKYIKAPEKTGLYHEVIRSIVRSGKMYSPSVNVFINNYSFMKSHFDDCIDTFLSVVGNNLKEESVIKIPFDRISRALVADISSRGEVGWKILLKKLDEWFSSLEGDTWEQSLKDYNNILQLLSERMRFSAIKLKPENVREPIIGHAISLAIEDEMTDKEFDFIVETMPRNIQRGTAREFLERLDGKNVTVEGFARLWDSYKSIINNINFQDLPNISIRKILIPAIQGDADRLLDFSRQNAKNLSQAIINADDDVRGEFLEYIIGLVDGFKGDETTGSKIEQVVSLLGVDKMLPTERNLVRGDDDKSVS
ncbi:P-loop NTPase fold protein [Brucella anthropi]|uniref:P-loop NTPase fold protein n=1 Tax=Brucella anthropi TaxID=529 RepID=UPI0023624164|nr:P-loop NTPase fold protein [Brucella anthropi]